MRAIYTGDARYDVANVFELDKETGHFHMINDREFSYPFEVVMNDTSWIIIAVSGELFFQLENLNPDSYFND